MSNHTLTFNDPDAGLAPPDLVGVLDPVPGGEDNLLRKDAWLQPLRVNFELWSDPAEAPEHTDVVQLIWDGDEGNPVDQKSFQGTGAPIDPSLLWLQVPVSSLDEGVHSLSYRLLPWNGSNPRSSETVEVTVDKTAPVLATASGLAFPSAILPPAKITAAYLAEPENQDQVVATVPAYSEIKVGDVVTFYWERSPGGRDIAGTRALELADLGKPVDVAFKGDLLRQSINNVDYFATYRVRDRAGNQSDLSLPVQLIVDIRPPTPRRFPTVKQASSSGASGVLTPFQGSSGVTVVVPATEVDPGEDVKVDFIGLGGEGGVGSIVAVQPITPGGLEFDIPARIVAANIAVGGDGRKVEVRYWAGRDIQHSAIYTLSIQPFSSNSIGSVECDKAQTGSPVTISKATVANSGANIHIEKWVYHESSQLINVWGIASGGRTDFLESQPAPISGSKFTTPLPKGFISPLALNSTFTLYAEVSFDQGHSFHPFKSLMIKVVP